MGLDTFGWVAKPLAASGLALAVAEALGVDTSFALAEPLTRSESEADGPVRSLRVLLAEDNPTNQKLACALLQKLGHQFAVANNGLEAVEQALAGSFEVILMDVQMPEMDGLEATRQIVEAAGDHRPRIIALTANASPEDRARCLDAGMDDYLTKPIRRVELVAALEQVPRAEGAEAEEGSPSLRVLATRTEFRQKVADLIGGEDPSFEEELISSFRTDLPGLLAAARAAHETADATGVGRAAHTIKSQAAVFGADALLAASRAVEQAAAEGLPDLALVEELERQADEVISNMDGLAEGA